MDRKLSHLKAWHKDVNVFLAPKCILGIVVLPGASFEKEARIELHYDSSTQDSGFHLQNIITL